MIFIHEPRNRIRGIANLFTTGFRQGPIAARGDSRGFRLRAIAGADAEQRRC